MSTAPPTTIAPPVSGVFEQHDEKGVLTSRTEVQDGVPHGQLTAFAPTGKPSMQANYQRGVLQGIARGYDDQGDLVQEATWLAGQQSGLTRLYAGGRLLSEQMFAKGLPHGETVFYSEAGVVTCKMNFRAGNIEGEALFFNEGELVRKAHYRKNLLDGEATDYDRDGCRVQSASYKTNLLDGWLRRYWPNGQVMEETQYRLGKPQGRPRKFNAKGASTSDEDGQASVMQRLEKLVRG